MDKAPRFSTAYDILVVDDGISFKDDPGFTKQEFQEECDINVIMSKYMKFGNLPAEAASPGQFGDFTNVPDLMEAQLIVKRAESDFYDLPSKVRERFGNDPVKLMQFIADAGNRDEAIKLGLIPEVPVEPVVAAPPPEAAGSPGIS